MVWFENALCWRRSIFGLKIWFGESVIHPNGSSMSDSFKSVRYPLIYRRPATECQPWPLANVDYDVDVADRGIVWNSACWRRSIFGLKVWFGQNSLSVIHPNGSSMSNSFNPARSPLIYRTLATKCQPALQTWIMTLMSVGGSGGTKPEAARAWYSLRITHVHRDKGMTCARRRGIQQYKGIRVGTS